MARTSNVVLFGFYIIFGMAAAEFDVELFEGVEPHLCIANVVTEYLKIADTCQKEIGKSQNFFFNIKEIDAVMPTLTLDPDVWMCILEKIEKHEYVEEYVIFCGSQMLLEDKVLAAKNTCECTINQLTELCKKKKN